MKILYYCEKFRKKIAELFSKDRIAKFGIRKSIYDFIVFMCHRSNSRLQLWAERKKDMIVQDYLYKKYEYVIGKYKK